MQFIVATAEHLKVSDSEISALLSQVYVEAGFTTQEVAAEKFAPSLVRKRGVLLCAREQQSSALAGMVIMVPFESQASVLAGEHEAEMHLLGVKPEYRGCGLGRLLVNRAITEAIARDSTKMILWTQQPMRAAQQLYESSGFSHTAAMQRGGIDFLVYEKKLIE